MGFVDRLQQNAARSAAARQGRADAGRGGRSGQGAKGRPKRPPAPPLDQLERRIGYAMAAVAVVVFVSIWVPHLGEVVPKVVTKAGKTVANKAASPTSQLVFGLVAAALLGWATVIKKRWLLAFVAFYVGLAGPWGKYHLIGYVMMAVGGWLLFRNAKLQSDAQRTTAAAASRSSRSPGRSASRSPASRSPASRSPASRSTASRSSPTRSGPSGRSTAGTRAAYATKPSPGSPRSTRGPSGKRQAPARARAGRSAKGSKVEVSETAVPVASKRYTPAQSGDRQERRERREKVRTGAANRSASPKV
ncbi:MAG: hypothetical protein ACRDWV_06580 [Acidimicrobiales bacterium]